MNRRALLTAVAAAAGVAGCLGRRTGSEGDSWDEYTWAHETPGWGLIASNGLVFGRERFSDDSEKRFDAEVDGGIFALEAETGDHRWTYGSTHPAYDTYSRLIVDDAVYATKTDDASHSRTSAVEFDGAERWSAIDGELNAVADGVAYVVEGIDDPTIRAVDATDGAELWTHPGASAGVDTGTAVPETVYAAGESVSAVNPADGTTRWRYEHDDDRSRVDAVSDGVVYTVTDFESVVAIADGEERWRTGSLSAPTVADVAAGLVLVLADSRLFAFDGTTGEQRWSQPATEFRVHGDRVYAVGGGVAALEVESGDEIWTTAVSGGSAESLAVDGRIGSEPFLFVRTERELHRLDPDGAVRRTWSPGEPIRDFAVGRSVVIAAESGLYGVETSE